MIREISISAEGATVEEVRGQIEVVMRRSLATCMTSQRTDNHGEGEWDSTKEYYGKIPGRDAWVGTQTMRFSTPEEQSHNSFVRSLLGAGDN